MRNPDDDRLIWTFATGPKKYQTMAKALAISLDLQQCNIPRGLITDSDDPELHSYFDVVSKPVPGYEHWFIKLAALDAFPEKYKRLIFVDGDSLAIQKLDGIFDCFEGHAFAVSCHWKTPEDNPDFDWYGDCMRVVKQLGFPRIPTFNAGFMYYERSDRTRELFKRTLEFRDQFDGFGLVRNQGQIGDDICISFAMMDTGIGTGFRHDLDFAMTPYSLQGSVHLDVLKGECSFIKGLGDPKLIKPLIYHTAHARWDLKYWREVNRLLALDRRSKGGPPDALLRFRKPMIVLTNWYQKLTGLNK
ncbi:MAG: hypothetical protein JNJ45_08305 [Chthonomonas sp.]|nr:hypothetical protein [Chthonomonas sp.]